ncbi:MAG: cysteine-rich small domain-containing protein [Oscillospiraceae bacterium]|jgi:Zn-finger protein|nr:cysteine-rich small domain-containing protein [Oscillospiraceae bacterium]
MDADEKRFAFFSHKDCEYFPCHRTADAESFNCLFCYCPLYALGEKCGGGFKYTASGIKSCEDCLFPHRRGNYDAVIGRFNELAEIAKRRG